MTFSLPSIDYQFATADTDYISRFNTNFQQINNAFIGARTDINNLNNQQGISLGDDWARVSEVGDPSGGILGPRSFVITHTSGSPDTITLSHGNADGFSYAYIAGTKRQTSDTLTVSPPTSGQGERFIGISADSLTGNVTAVESGSTGTAGELVLYKYDHNAGTASNFRRMPRTLLMSNTLEQARQETPQIVTNFNNNQSVDSTHYFIVPFECSILGFSHMSPQVTGTWEGTVTLSAELGSGSVDVHEIDYSSGLSSSSTTATSSTIKTTYKDGSVFPANTVFKMFADGTNSGVANHVFSMKIKPEYNMPTLS